MHRAYKFALAAAGLALVGIASPIAFAHSTGHESRTSSECEKLPGSAKEGERAGCLVGGAQEARKSDEERGSPPNLFTN